MMQEMLLLKTSIITLRKLHDYEIIKIRIMKTHHDMFVAHRSDVGFKCSAEELSQVPVVLKFLV